MCVWCVLCVLYFSYLWSSCVLFLLNLIFVFPCQVTMINIIISRYNWFWTGDEFSIWMTDCLFIIPLIFFIPKIHSLKYIILVPYGKIYIYMYIVFVLVNFPFVHQYTLNIICVIRLENKTYIICIVSTHLSISTNTYFLLKSMSLYRSRLVECPK